MIDILQQMNYLPLIYHSLTHSLNDEKILFKDDALSENKHIHVYSRGSDGIPYNLTSSLLRDSIHGDYIKDGPCNGAWDRYTKFWTNQVDIEFMKAWRVTNNDYEHNTFLTNSTDLTFSFWVCFKTAKNRSVQFYSANKDSSQIIIGFHPKNDSSIYGQDYFEVVVNCPVTTEGYEHQVISKTHLYLNTWYKITFTYCTDIKSGESYARLYCDNKEIAVLKRSVYKDKISYVLAKDFDGLYICQLRLYYRALSEYEIKKMNSPCLLNYDFIDHYLDISSNLASESAYYNSSTFKYNTEYKLDGWGGDDGTVTYYPDGGYLGYPYKRYHITSNGTGGAYKKITNDILIEPNTQYTMSVYVRASRDFQDIPHSFNINGPKNDYITCEQTINFTQDWQRIVHTFNSGSKSGKYGEMSIVYFDDEQNSDFWVDYSGFKIEKGDTATSFFQDMTHKEIVSDSSGEQNNGIISGNFLYEKINNDTDIPGTICAVFQDNKTHISIDNCFLGNTSEFTYSIACNMLNPTGATQCLGCCRKKLGSGFAIFVIDGKLRIDTETQWETNYAIPANKWILITVTKEKSHIKLYINGKFISSTESSQINMINYSDIFTIGQSQVNNTNFDNGCLPNTKITDIKFYAGALSSDDILKYYKTKAFVSDDYGFISNEMFENRAMVVPPRQTEVEGIYKTNQLINNSSGDPSNYQVFMNNIYWNEWTPMYENINSKNFPDSVFYFAMPRKIIIDSGADGYMYDNIGTSQYGGVWPGCGSSFYHRFHIGSSTDPINYIDNKQNRNSIRFYPIGYYKHMIKKGHRYKLCWNMSGHCKYLKIKWKSLKDEDNRYIDIKPSPSNEEFCIPTENNPLDGTMECFYKFTILDDIWKIHKADNLEWLSYCKLDIIPYNKAGEDEKEKKAEAIFSNIRLFDITDCEKDTEINILMNHSIISDNIVETTRLYYLHVDSKMTNIPVAIYKGKYWARIYNDNGNTMTPEEVLYCSSKEKQSYMHLLKKFRCTVIGSDVGGEIHPINEQVHGHGYYYIYRKNEIVDAPVLSQITNPLHPLTETDRPILFLNEDADKKSYLKIGKTQMDAKDAIGFYSDVPKLERTELWLLISGTELEKFVKPISQTTINNYGNLSSENIIEI